MRSFYFQASRIICSNKIYDFMKNCEVFITAKQIEEINFNYLSQFSTSDNRIG